MKLINSGILLLSIQSHALLPLLKPRPCKGGRQVIAWKFLNRWQLLSAQGTVPTESAGWRRRWTHSPAPTFFKL